LKKNQNKPDNKRREGKRMEIRECKKEGCGKEFLALYGDQEYCPVHNPETEEDIQGEDKA